jgi:hypothetical protein
MNANNGFTFYGDLLGIGSAYQLSADLAYKKLNLFYNTVFGFFEPLCADPDSQLHVRMFSDSVLIWGTLKIEVIDLIQRVYLDLINNNLLLRGAIVHGAIEREPRTEAKDFRKFLPTNDTLARAVGLEKTVKGARLIIESRLAQHLLIANPEWLTLEGYIEHANTHVPLDSVLRRICPSPSGTNYELLYFWKCSEDSQGPFLRVIAERLKEISEFQDSHVSDHLRETLKVLRRSEIRQSRTERLFNL